MPNSGGSELNVLLRHVPKIVVSRFLNKRERPRGPESSSFLAAVALFDISGFSSLGSRLSEDEQRQSRDTTNSSNNVSTISVVGPLSPSAAAIGPTMNKRPLLSSVARSNSVAMLNTESKASKSPISHPLASSIPSVRSSNTGSSERKTLSSRCDDDLSLADDKESPSPSDLMRQRRMINASSSINMSFRHGTKTSVATQGIAVETLTTALNKSLEPVIDVILKHGGDIIKFAGDALIVMWETEVSQGRVTPKGELVYRAVCGALEALQALRAAVTTNDENESDLQLLGMHVGIGVSEMTGNHVGGVLNRWEFYLSGDANRQMSFAEENAQKGQLALSPEAFEALELRFASLPELDIVCHKSGNYLVCEVPGDPVEIYPRRPSVPTPVLEASADLIAFLRCYVPGAIVSHLQKGLIFTPCRLNVTVAFVKLTGVVEIADKDTQLQTIHQSLCTIQECAYKAQGTLRQFIIDDKGAVAIVAIGLPPFFHENNAVRGIKFASYVLESGIKASIGVTTGSVYCGSVGSSARAEYAVVGDSINLSARLMSAAPVGEIYCDGRTHKETKDSVHFQETLDMRVKGKTEPIQVFPVRKFTQASDTFHANLFETSCPAPYGCSHILDAVPLFGSTSKPSNDGHRALVICGDSGTGKTMLLNHVMQRHSLRCFKGNGDSMDTAVDFHAWRGIAKALATATIKVSSNKLSIPTIDVTTIDTGPSSFEFSKSSNVTVHRPSHHGRLRSHTLTTHEELRDDHETDTEISTIERMVERGSLSLTDNFQSQRVPVLDYLAMQQQVTKETLKTLPSWLPYECSGTTSVENSSEKSEGALKSFRQVLFAMISVVSAAKPIMLVFDDAQWMDNRSLSLVLKVLEELPNVYFLITVRGISKHTASARSMLLALVMSLPNVDTGQMNCFTYQETSLFLCQQYHITIMDTQLLAFVFERTEGNPGSLIKLLSFMLDAKYIAIEPECNNIVILKDLDEMDTIVPQHIRARVMSIVGSLDALAQSALKLLSINPQPSEENMVNGVLTLLSASHQDRSLNSDVSAIRLKVPRPTVEISLLQQVRESLKPCEKSLVTIHKHNQLYFFNTEEMRLVVYDTMLPSQRKVLHALYAEWLQLAAVKSTQVIPPSLATATTSTSLAAIGHEQMKGSPAIYPMPYQQYALLGFHLSQSDNPKKALEAYYLSAEGAMEAKELSFAEDCMLTSSKILNTHPRINDLTDLDIILLRSRIEFIRGTIAVENNDFNLAITHMSYVTRLFNRKGSVLRQYSSNIQREGLSFNASRRTSLVMSTVEAVPATPGCFSLIPTTPKLNTIETRCLPRLFSFSSIFPSISRATSRQRSIKLKQSKSLVLPRVNRVQAEETLEALDQINFYRRKASTLVKQINYANKKQDELHRHIQKFAQKSLLTKDKR